MCGWQVQLHRNARENQPALGWGWGVRCRDGANGNAWQVARHWQLRPAGHSMMRGPHATWHCHWHVISDVMPPLVVLGTACSLHQCRAAPPLTTCASLAGPSAVGPPWPQAQLLRHQRGR